MKMIDTINEDNQCCTRWNVGRTLWEHVLLALQVKLMLPGVGRDGRWMM